MTTLHVNGNKVAENSYSYDKVDAPPLYGYGLTP